MSGETSFLVNVALASRIPEEDKRRMQNVEGEMLQSNMDIEIDIKNRLKESSLPIQSMYKVSWVNVHNSVQSFKILPL